MARLDLKATVLTLAMLLPTTWSLVWLTLRPERPVNSALVSAMEEVPRVPGATRGVAHESPAGAHPLPREAGFDRVKRRLRAAHPPEQLRCRGGDARRTWKTGGNPAAARR